MAFSSEAAGAPCRDPEGALGVGLPFWWKFPGHRKCRPVVESPELRRQKGDVQGLRRVALIGRKPEDQTIAPEQQAPLES